MTDLPPVQADPQKIGWVLNQLFDNGIKFTPSGGRVVVSVKRKATNLVMVSVTDTGIGIPVEPLGRRSLNLPSTGRFVHAAATAAPGWAFRWCGRSWKRTARCWMCGPVEGHGTTFKFPLLAIAKAEVIMIWTLETLK